MPRDIHKKPLDYPYRSTKLRTLAIDGLLNWQRIVEFGLKHRQGCAETVQAKNTNLISPILCTAAISRRHLYKLAIRDKQIHCYKMPSVRRATEGIACVADAGQLLLIVDRNVCNLLAL